SSVTDANPALRFQPAQPERWKRRGRARGRRVSQQRALQRREELEARLLAYHHPERNPPSAIRGNQVTLSLVLVADEPDRSIFVLPREGVGKVVALGDGQSGCLEHLNVPIDRAKVFFERERPRRVESSDIRRDSDREAHRLSDSDSRTGLRDSDHLRERSG